MKNKIITLILLVTLSVFANAFAKDSAKEFSDAGIELAKQSKYDEAVISYARAIELNPNFTEAYYGRGLAYGRKGEFDKAIADFTTVMILDPGFAGAYNDRAVTYCSKKEYNKAWADVHKAEELGYKVNPDFLIDLKKASGREK